MYDEFYLFVDREAEQQHSVVDRGHGVITLWENTLSIWDLNQHVFADSAISGEIRTTTMQVGKHWMYSPRGPIHFKCYSVYFSSARTCDLHFEDMFRRIFVCVSWLCRLLLTVVFSVSSTKKASPFSPSFMCKLAGSPLISMSTCRRQL